MPSTRRSLLAGAAAMLAGCATGSPGSGTEDGTPGGTEPPATTEPPPEAPLEIGETAAVEGLDVRPTDASVQDSYVVLVYPDFADVVAAEGRQYLFLTVEVGGTDGAPAPGPADFRVATDDGTYAGRQRGEGGHPYRDGAAYTRDAASGWLLFELPAPVESERLAVEFRYEAGDGGTATWRLPDAVAEQLRTPPPEFEVRDFEAPDSVRPDEPIEVTATVANVGDGPGTFRGSLNQEGDVLYAADPFSFDLDAGAERTWTGTVTTHQRGSLESEVTVRLRFRSAGGDADRDVLVRPPGTTSAG